MGNRRSRSGARRIVVVGSLLLLVAGGAGLWWFLQGRDAHPVPEFSFRIRRVTAASVGDTPSDDTLQATAEEIRETLDALYVAGFIDPDEWEGGTFPAVIELFGPGTQERAEADLQALSLGDSFSEIRSVEPALGTMSVRVLLDAEQRPVSAVAITRFVADGSDRSGQALLVRHRGSYYLAPDEDGRWVIVGYDVTGEIEPGARNQSPTEAESP